MTTDADLDTSTRPDSTQPRVAVRVRERNHRFLDSAWAALVASAVILLITALAALFGSATM